MPIFRLATARIKIYQIHHVSFWNQETVFFKLCSTLQCHERQFFCTFSSKTWKAFDERNPSKENFQTFNCLHENEPNSLSYFKPQVSFHLSFESPFSVMTQNSSEIFWLKHYALNKKSPSKYKFPNFWVLHRNFTQFLMSVLKPQGQSSFKFCITFRCHEI